MIRLKIMYLPFLFLKKNGFEEGTTKIASRSYPVNTKHLAAACYPPHPVNQFTPFSFSIPNMYPVWLGLSYLQPLWLLLLSCVGIGTTFWAAPQFSHTASAGRARVSPSGISGVFSGFVAYLVVITHANVVFLMIWRQESRKACASLQSLNWGH